MLDRQLKRNDYVNNNGLTRTMCPIDKYKKELLPMNIKETLTTLLPGVEISDEFVTKLTASIEAAVTQRVEEETKSISEKAEGYKAEIAAKAAEYEAYANEQIKEVTDKANAYAEYVVEEMTQKVDDYCEYVVEKFVKENKEKLVDSAEYARMAKVLSSIREAFEVNFFQLDPEPANKSLEAQLEESKKAFNELFEEHRSLKRQISDYSAYVDSENRKSVFARVTEGMADTQKDRLGKLVEKANFETLEEYEAGVALMAEEFKNASTKTVSTPIKEEKTVIVESASNDKMKAYLERL
jgi:hypothetical protein